MNVHYKSSLKKVFKKILKSLSLILSVIFSLQLIACEDDAILQPQSVDEECDNPSYCNLSMPNSQNDFAEAKLKIHLYFRI